MIEGQKGTREPKLLLFDIDGTLITSGGAGERALRDALLDRFGIRDDLADVELAGRTDANIASRILQRHSIEPDPANTARFLDGYLHHLALQLPQHKGRLLPGILPLLERLKGRHGIVLALLTGNLRSGAHLKLQHFGVWDYFEFGAFADDHHDRNELGPFARARAAERHGITFRDKQIYVIGDTPRDVACGRAINAITVAIATGGSTEDELRAASPDFLFRDLSDTDAVLGTLGW